MTIHEIVYEAYQLLISAEAEDNINEDQRALDYLVKLREFLNNQPELEAGGALPTTPA